MCPRYSRIELPAYRFVPGLNAHPRRDPSGHSAGRDEPHVDAWSPSQWHTLECYLYAVDLFNLAYWWECHEQLEALWLAAGKTSTAAQFAQGILQVAAANLNHHLGKTEAARSQAEAGIARLAAAEREQAVYMGVDIAAFCNHSRRWLAGEVEHPSTIELHLL
jgi:hypothetical protein